MRHEGHLEHVNLYLLFESGLFLTGTRCNNLGLLRWNPPIRSKRVLLSLRLRTRSGSSTPTRMQKMKGKKDLNERIRIRHDSRRESESLGFEQYTHTLGKKQSTSYFFLLDHRLCNQKTFFFCKTT